MALGVIAFLGVFLCGGLAVGGWWFLRPYFDNSVAGNTDKDGGSERATGRETEVVEAGGTEKLGPKGTSPTNRGGAPPAENDKPRTVPELMRALKDPDAKVRLAAANTLGERGPAAALAAKPLGEALKDPDAKVRLAAAKALGRIGPTAHPAYPALVHALGDDDEAVRKAARASLGTLKKSAGQYVPELSAALKDPSAPVRVFALQALLGMDMDVKKAAPLYAALLKDEDRGLRLEAARALGKVGPKGRDAAFAALLEAQKDKDPEVRKAAADALAAMDPGPPATCRRCGRR